MKKRTLSKEWDLVMSFQWEQIQILVFQMRCRNTSVCNYNKDYVCNISKEQRNHVFSAMQNRDFLVDHCKNVASLLYITSSTKKDKVNKSLTGIKVVKVGFN